MLTAIILVCALSVTPDVKDCGRHNAVAVLQAPEEFNAPAHCFMRGQAYLAETSIGRELAADEVVKITCARSRPRDLR